jgi:CRP/FNR family transcriptional regulator, cyclic AMP receptor protein
LLLFKPFATDVTEFPRRHSLNRNIDLDLPLESVEFADRAEVLCNSMLEASKRCAAGGGVHVMAIDILVAPLLRVPLLQGLKPLQLKEIARQVERIVFRAGAEITRAGASADAAILVISGPAERVSPVECDGQPEWIEPGSLLGEMAMFIEHEYGLTVVARGLVRALRLTRTALHAQMLNDPTLADHFVHQIALRLTSIASELGTINQVLAASPQPA